MSATTPAATQWMRNVWTLTRRNFIHVMREPAQMSDATVQPVLFTVLFVYIFGSAMHIAGGSYVDFAVGGLVVMNLTTASMGTAVGLSSDLSTGVMDRFRTLPMPRSTILAGRTLADLLASVLCGTHRAGHRLRHRLAARQRDDRRGRRARGSRWRSRTR